MVGARTSPTQEAAIPQNPDDGLRGASWRWIRGGGRALSKRHSALLNKPVYTLEARLLLGWCQGCLLTDCGEVGGDVERIFVFGHATVSSATPSLLKRWNISRSIKWGANEPSLQASGCHPPSLSLSPSSPRVVPQTRTARCLTPPSPPKRRPPPLLPSPLLHPASNAAPLLLPLPPTPSPSPSPNDPSPVPPRLPTRPLSPPTLTDSC